mgnify:CR=1 FL=1
MVKLSEASTVLADVVSIANTPTKHGKVRVIPDSDPLQFDSEEGFKVNVDLKVGVTVTLASVFILL